MHPQPLSTRHVRRVLSIMLTIMSPVGTLLLTSGNTSAARKAIHPTIPAVGEALAHYPQGDRVICFLTVNRSSKTRKHISSLKMSTPAGNKPSATRTRK